MLGGTRLLIFAGRQAFVNLCEVCANVITNQNLLLPRPVLSALGALPCCTSVLRSPDRQSDRAVVRRLVRAAMRPGLDTPGFRPTIYQ